MVAIELIKSQNILKISIFEDEAKNVLLDLREYSKKHVPYNATNDLISELSKLFEE